MKLFFICSSMLLLGGCMSINTMQSARPVNQGDYSFSLAGGNASVEYELSGEKESISVPIMEIGARYGVAKNFDIGVKTVLPGATSFDGKYMLLGEGQPLAVSTGLSYGSFELSNGEGESEVKSSTSDLAIPVNVTYDINDMFSVHLNPKYIIRSSETTYANGDPSESNSNNVISIGLGANYGWFYAEYATISGIEDSFSQVMFGLNTGWDDVQGRPYQSSAQVVKEENEVQKTENKKKKRKKRRRSGAAK